MKAKMFSGSTVRGVEQDVNDWLTLHPKTRVEHVLQSESAGADETKFNFTISIFYEDNSEATEAPVRVESRAATPPELESLPRISAPSITS